MKIAYNPEATALTAAPSNNDITFDLAGKAIYARGVKFEGTNTTYSVFKKHTSDNSGGYDGLVPVPSYTTTTTRYLREDGTWDTPNYKVWTAYAGVDYTGWVTLVEWKMSKQNSFSPKPFMFSIHRNYNSPTSESYTFSITSGYDTATITLISGNARARIIEQIRIVKCEDAKTYKLEMFVDEARRTYKNTCTCIVYGYSDFIGTTTCVKNTDNDVTVLTQIPTVSGKLVGTITNADLANTLNYIKLPSCGDKTSNSVWCKFAKLTFNRSSYDCVSGYLFFSGSESVDNKGILYYLFRCLEETNKVGMGNLQWLVKSNSSIEVIAKKIEPCIYNLYINNLNPWTTPIIHNLASTGAFTWDIGEWGSKPEVSYISTDIGRVNYSNESLKLNRTIETDVNSCYEDLKLKYYTLSGCSSSTSTDGKRYAGIANSYGFPVSNNANSMLWLGSHSTNYGHQLGFSSDGRIYDRYISNGSFSTSANGGSWNKIAWTHEIPTKISQLTNDSGYLTSNNLSNYVTLNTPQTITGLKTFESNSETTGVSLILKNKKWKAGMSTAIDFYNGNSYEVPQSRIETKMLDDGRNGGTLIFYTQEKHSETNPNPNVLIERFRIGDDGVSKITGLLAVTGNINLAGNNYHYKDKYGINMNNSDIIGVNSIVTLDLAESGNEGIKFYRDATHVDSLWAQNGNLYFNQNMEVTSDGCINGTNRTVIHSGNIGSQSVNYATNADKLDGYDAGLTNNSVAIYVPFPSSTTLKSLNFIDANYGTEGYGNPDEEFLKGVCKWAIATYSNQDRITLIGSITPNSSGTCILHLYSSSGKDSTTKLPRYCRGLYLRLDGCLYHFGTYNYTWSYGRFASTSEFSNYYWANIPISATSDTTTSPTFANAITTGLLTVSSGSTHKGIKIGNNYINAINGDLIIQNNTAIRFGDDAWDYDVWAGLKYVSSVKTIHLGIADKSIFSANNALGGGTLNLPGVYHITSSFYNIKVGRVVEHTPSTSGWYTVARVSGYFNYDVYTTGNWNYGIPSIVRVNICNINGTSKITQLTGYIGDNCSQIRLGKVSKNEWDVQVYIPGQSGPIGTQRCIFTGIGSLTVYDTSAISSTSYSETNTLVFGQISGISLTTDNYTSYLDGRYYTESEIDTKLNSYLPLLGGLMDSNAYISWNNGANGNDVSDWKKITGNGLRIISSVTTTSNAPTRYATALHVKGRYGFQLASAGGVESNSFYIRNLANDNWHALIHSGNISTQSVNYATSAGHADTAGNASNASKLTVHDVRNEARDPNYFGASRVTAWFNNTGTPSATWHSGIHVKGWTNSYTSWELCSYSSTGTDNDYDLYFRSGNNTTWGNWKTVAFISDIPTVGNGKVTIKQGGTSKGSFTMNQSGDTTIELTDNNSDTKVTQTVTTDTNTSWRPFIVGKSYNDSEPFAPATVTDSVYATHKLRMQPSTGNIQTYGYIKLYAASGDSPHLIFQRGTDADNTYDWDQYVTGGYFKIRYNKAETWTEMLSLYPGNNLLEGHKIWTAGNDGAGSGLDADTTDGLHLYTRTLGVNGTDWTFASTANSNATTHIYAATSAGTSGLILKSTGGTPTWMNTSDLTAGKITCVAATSNIFRPFVLTNESNQLYYSTKIKGNYSTGKIQISGIEIEDTDGDTPLIRFGSANKDSILWKVFSTNNTYANQGVYGFDMTYFGTGSGNSNRLVLHADNLNSETKVEAISITQDGVVTFSKTISGSINGNAATSTTADQSKKIYMNNSSGDSTYPVLFTNRTSAGTPRYDSVYVDSAAGAGYNPNTNAFVSSIMTAGTHNSTSTLYLSSANSCSIIFKIGDIEKARFALPNGYLGINTTTITYPLTVNGIALVNLLRVSTANLYRDAGGIILNNSDIWGVNAIYTWDLAEDAKEGYLFKRTNGNYDSIWCKDGNFYFSPDGNSTDGYGTTYTVYHSGNLTKSTIGLGNVQNTAFYQRVTTVNGTAWNMAGTNSNAAFTIYAPTTAGTAGLILLSNGSGAPVWGSLPGHSHAYLPLAGGTMNNTAIISRKGYSVSWYLGRDGAMIKSTEYNGYNPILSMKTTNGSWDLGVYTGDTAYLTYITDTDHDTPKNTCTYQLTFPKKTGTLAITSEIPSIPSSLPANGGNADTIDGYHIVVTNKVPTTPTNKTIYFIY